MYKTQDQMRNDYTWDLLLCRSHSAQQESLYQRSRVLALNLIGEIQGTQSQIVLDGWIGSRFKQNLDPAGDPYMAAIMSGVVPLGDSASR